MKNPYQNKSYKIALVALFAALSAVGAFIRVPIPVLPFTLQLFFTTMAGLLLGGELGALSVVTYVMIGLLGVPVFTGGGGITYVFQPSFGYLLGFVAGAFVTGKLTETERPSFLRVLLACYAGLLAVYLIGVPYLYLVLRFNMQKTLAIDALILNYFLAFMPTDAIKMVLAAVVGHRLIPVLRKTRRKRSEK
ncbi:MAG: biotin transporter BioY [Clostridiales bacterium]|nr:biotin transporter BioY [Clostridiales bacterium]